jgi:hypothetical protein
MVTDYGRPPLAEQNRALMKQRLEEARAGDKVRETLTVEWRGQPLHVEVIDVPVESLYYNPSTHRIRAQRSHDPVRDRALDQDAWNAESQDYLHYLLQALPADPSKRDPDFDTLLESLRDFKQNDPGLVTYDGILVNGNTRRAALKELGVASIRVAVLPESCTWADINAVELSLQLRKDHRREYSYINRLLAIEEQMANGRQVADIAREFRIKVATCEQDIWILAALRDLMARSKEGDIQLRLMDFEDAQEKLRELHRRYTKESSNKSNADLLKETRLAAIVLDFSKTDVRLIEPEFRARYLDQRLPPALKAATPAAPAAVAIPGLNRSVKTSDDKVTAARALTDVILKARAVKAVGGTATSEQIAEAAALLEDTKYAFNEALVPAGKDARLRKKRQAAPDRINDACQDLQQCVTDVVLARGSNSLDEEAFDEAVLHLRDTLRKLAIESARSIKAPGDGVSWLIDSTGKESG